MAKLGDLRLKFSTMWFWAILKSNCAHVFQWNIVTIFESTEKLVLPNHWIRFAVNRKSHFLKKCSKLGNWWMDLTLVTNWSGLKNSPRSHFLKKTPWKNQDGTTTVQLLHLSWLTVNFFFLIAKSEAKTGSLRGFYWTRWLNGDASQVRSCQCFIAGQFMKERSIWGVADASALRARWPLARPQLRPLRPADQWSAAVTRAHHLHPPDKRIISSIPANSLRHDSRDDQGRCFMSSTWSWF